MGMSLPHGLAVGLSLLTAALPSRTLGPENVFLLVNKNVRASQEVADYYCRKRGVPAENVIRLDLPKGEDISRRDYNVRLVAPLREALKSRQEKAKVLLSVYGVPLRVGPQEPNAAERAQLAKLKPEIDKLQAEVKTSKDKEHGALSGRLKELQAKQRELSYAESQASVDSELSLLWWYGYDLRRWQVNMLYFQVPEVLRRQRPPVVMVCRLDGPSVAIVKGLVDQAVEVEQHGLTGRVYVDARGIKYDAKEDTGYGYAGYDESLREMARLLERSAQLPVTLDDLPDLFAPGSCPDCALYCGWYSLGKYVNCCRFVPGAVAYHIASSEAVSLRNLDSTYWCKCLLEHGVAATLGPVAEPYTIGFPKPAEFFGFLVTGRYTLVECYYRTALFTSWMTVLVGDPLYNPYAPTPKLTPDQVKPSPVGGRFLLQSKP
jgi:uncharacterized protein (TIGR03790 family)